MRETLKYYLHKYFIIFPFILLVSLPLLILSIIPTNKGIILKGDTEVFRNVINVETDYTQTGSFSTIYVSTMEKSTVFQNLVVSGIKTAELYDLSKSETHLTRIESWQASKIQYKSSIGNALVLAYALAKLDNATINLDYSFQGFGITYYGPKSSFRIGDTIIKIKSNKNNNLISSKDDEADFRRVINLEKTVGDIYTVIRDGVEKEITLTENDTFYAYSIYNYDGEKSTPKFSYSDSNVGGPSGGLLQTLSIYNQLTETDLTHGLKIAGTGTISYTGEVGIIGGIKEKIPTALDDNIDVFFCAAGNYDDAYETYKSIPGHQNMKLVKIETFYDALEYLKEGYKNDFRD